MLLAEQRCQVPHDSAGRVTRSVLASVKWAAPVYRALAGAGALAFAYQLVHWSGIVDPRVLPSVTAILAQIARLSVSAEYLVAVRETLAPALLGMIVAWGIALPLGLLLGTSRFANDVTGGLIDLMRSLPGTALIPVCIFVIGQGETMKVTVVVYATVWPILFNTIYGIRSVDPVAILSARSCRISRMAMWRRVMLPSAAPFIATGMRYALPISIVVVIACEIVVGSPEGIGGFLLLQQSDVEYRPDIIYAVLLCAGLVGFLVNLLFDAACDRIVGWEIRRSEQT